VGAEGIFRPVLIPHKQAGHPMPYATVSDNIRLYYEEAGSVKPILFVH
jgi:hypothetical protein